MVAFTFVIKKEGKSWHATRVASETEEEGEAISAEAEDTYSLQKELYSKALEQASGAVRTSFSVVSPKSAVYQVGVGGAVMASGGGGGSSAAAGGGAAAEEGKEQKKEEPEEEEEEDDDMGFSLFD